MKIKKILAFALAMLLFVGCAPKTPTEKPVEKEVVKKTVVATTTFLADQAKQLAGDFINVKLLIPAGEDPHVYEAKPEELESLKKADLVLFHGLHFEGKMVEPLEKLEKDGKAVRVSKKFEKSELGEMEEDGVKETDPHFWFDLKLYEKSVKETSEGLQKLLPDNAKKIKENTDKYIKELHDLDGFIKTELAKIPEGSRKLVTPHDAFGYFSRAYGVEVKAPQGVTTEGEVSTADINETAEYIVKNKVKAIFVESTTPEDRMKKLQDAVKKKGFEVKVVMGEGKELFSDSLAESGEASTFIGMYKHNIKLMVENLNNMKNIIHVEDMTIAYQENPVIWDIDLDFEERSRIAIIGPNGAGKSTLMKGMLGLIKPISGVTTFWGKSYKEVYKDVAYIPQQGAVNWDFPTTVLDVVTMGRYVHLGWFRRPSKKDKSIAYEALEKMGMSEFANRQIGMLSGGQKQRVFLARAIAQDAKVYFMDEPLAGVDKKTEKIIMGTIKEFQDQGKTTIVVHHDLNTVEEYFDKVVMVNKVVKASGRVEEVFNQENIGKTYGWTI